jgi:hypothetical protein
MAATLNKKGPQKPPKSLFGATPNLYPLPDCCTGQCTRQEYDRWLTIKAATLLDRDKKRGMPYASGATKSVYKEKLHAAIIAGGKDDPYTGDPLRWDLISKWDTSRTHEAGYKKLFALMPTADHVRPDADVLEFAICSWEINDAKSDLDPDEFVALCTKVVVFRRT